MFIQQIRNLAGLFVGLAIAWNLAGTPSALAGGSAENLALGKSYSMNAVPTQIWLNKQQPMPAFDHLLTDGQYESGSFHTSRQCANFTRTAKTIEITIDLGQIQPISEIYAHHFSRPTSGLLQSRLEEYFVSDDNVSFYKVGQFVNTIDPATEPVTLAMKANFFNGIMKFTSGPIQAAGRYVMIRTTAAGFGPFPSYAGYDEIVVCAGNFDPATLHGHAVATFSDGNGNTLPDQYTGTVGDGWNTPWQAFAWPTAPAGTASATVVNTNPLTGASDANHLAVSYTTTGTPGHSVAGVRRQYDPSVVDWTLAHTVAFLFRVDSATGFSTADAITMKGSSVISSESNLTGWRLEWNGNRWRVFNGNGTGGASLEILTGISASVGTTFAITVDVRPEDGRWDLTIFDGTNTITRTDLLFRSTAADKAQDNYIGFMGRGSAQGDAANFSIDQLTVNQDPGPLVQRVTEIPEDQMGYKIVPKDWYQATAGNPILLNLGPNGYLGDDTFHLAVDGVFWMEFVSQPMVFDVPENAQLSIDLPNTVELLSYNTKHQAHPPQALTRDGQPYTTYSYTLDANYSKSRSSFPFLALASKNNQPSSNIGKGYYRYSYTLNGISYTPDEQSVTFVVDPRISAPAPHHFFTGFWKPYQQKTMSNASVTLARMYAGYKEAGINAAIGGTLNPIPTVSNVLKQLDIANMGGSAPINNGLMIRDINQYPASDYFEYHPDKMGNSIGISATLLSTDNQYFQDLVTKSKAALERADDLYSNWEPYMFLGRGSIDGLSKQAFQSFANLSDSEVNALWPNVVIDPNSQTYNQFSSWQYGQIIQRAQQAARLAGVSLNLNYQPDFIISVNPWAFFDSRVNQLVHPSQYLNKIDKLIIWSYDNWSDIRTYAPADMVGNNLTPFVPMFDMVMDAVRQYGPHDNSGILPRVIFMQNEYQFGFNLSYPKDFTFTAILAFIMGADGSTAYSHNFMPDARYLAAYAQANAFIAAFEDVVSEDNVQHNVQATPVSPVPQQIAGRPVTTLLAKSFVAGGQQYVAVGNDYDQPVFVRIAMTNPPLANSYFVSEFSTQTTYQKTSDVGFAAADLAQGIIIKIPGKQWAMLHLVPDYAPQNGYTLLTQAQVETQLADLLPQLEAALNRF